MTKITCLYPHYLIPVEPRATVLTQHALVMQDDKILAVLPADQARQQYASAKHLEMPEHAILPGLINLHAHSAMSLLRGLADDLSLMDWLNHHIWPAEKKHVSDEFVFDGSVHAMAEMIRGGTTTVNDMYFCHEAVARAGVHTGMRTIVGCSILEFPTVYANDADEYISKALAARQSFVGQAGISFRLAPHAPYTVADETFSKIIALSEKLGIDIHCHIHETQDEVDTSLKQYGMRPLERLHQLGLLSPALIAAHVVHANDAEIALLARQGVHVAHNPASNLKLASGFARVHDMQTAGIQVGIGTDGAASNNKLDLLGDLRMAALLSKAQSGNPTALNASIALEMATLSGAKALGMDQQIGSLVAGKQADLIAIDLSAIETQPLFDPISQIVYAAGREQVSHVWVNGKCLMSDRVFCDLQMDQLLDKARWWQKKIAVATV
ncbi:TRZ/ATZ family hydrolase [Undibacterium sp. RTI2.1]|uniref:TRZ/ATZ family hydrolase n=1 Tax=unclassified Undibacterium TaxID=2630295 RepID=UPI002B2361F3|nr:MULTISPECIES: TRZ/ATZ family hydrolase [unclassified Undibacterium]MEB0030831.1 TRZ/ATZ family hydrolase [Undibacterium sp. RTI2.1]MEB0117326.1 TRZ/ATZ family hydrolase [Undibacterium sp. RTI2.2]MEB0231018.1 TRZ/ATZ family hydrolase [Undibacterium sp. 10I3]